MDHDSFKTLIKNARGKDSPFPLSAWYEGVARAARARDWNTLSASLGKHSDEALQAAVAACARQLGSSRSTIFTNPYVHQDLKESRTAFLTRVRHIEYGRTNRSYGAEEALSVYIHSADSYASWRAIQAIVREGDFRGLDGRFKAHHFAVEIGSALASWLRNNNVEVLYRQMALWLAAKDFMTPSHRGIMREQLYPPFFDLVAALKASHFGPDQPVDAVVDEDDILARYLAAWRTEFGGAPPRLLAVPYALGYLCREEWSVATDFDIRFPRLFLTKADWQLHVLGDSQDPVLRSESDDGSLWRAWRHQFAIFDSNPQHVYTSLAAAPQPRGYVYVVEQAGAEPLYKIGYTGKDDATMRLRSLQTGSGTALKLLGSFRCSGRATEAALHKRFATSRRAGEWFALSPEEAAEILDERWRSNQNIF